MMSEQERLQTLLQKREMNAKDFAAEVGISAATMSNILGGRNKPSLEVMQKVLHRFREVSPEWLILGVGTMYKLKLEAQEQVLFDVKPEIPEQAGCDENSMKIRTTPTEENGIKEATSTAVAKNQKQSMPVQIVERVVAKKVTKVVVFFEDGTFQEL